MKQHALLAAWLMLVSSLAFSTTLMTRKTRSSETSADLQRTTRRYSPEITVLFL
jgi:hypothetical protein